MFFGGSDWLEWCDYVGNYEIPLPKTNHTVYHFCKRDLDFLFQ